MDPADTPPYFPVGGPYTIAFGMPFDLNQNGAPANSVFQLDDEFGEYLESKTQARSEELDKYFCTADYSEGIPRQVAQFIVSRLVREYPRDFQLQQNGARATLTCARTGEKLEFGPQMELLPAQGSRVQPPYSSSLDALAMQVQEDLVVIRRDLTGRDWLAAVHLCAPNHWGAAEKIGSSWCDVHRPVAGMKNWRRSAASHVQRMIEGAFERFVWGLGTDRRLNHHPPPTAVDGTNRRSLAFDRTKPELYMRIERQLLIGFSECNAALFTIRTYFRDVAEIRQDPERRRALVEAIESMSAETLKYKGLTDARDGILDWLQEASAP